MKKTLSVIMAIALTLTSVFCFSRIAYAGIEWASGDVTVKYDSGTITVSGKGDMADYTGNTDKNKVWRDYVNEAKKLVIENGVTSIGNFAFSSMFAIETVSIPDTVTRIGERAFYASRSITSFSIPASVTSIGNDALRTATDSVGSNLQNITVDNSNPNYCSLNGVLYNKAKTILISVPSANSLAEPAVPDTVREIKDYAALKCTNLKTVLLPESVKTIGTKAFYGCSSLKTVLLPESVKTIGTKAFYGCSSLQKITIKNNNCVIPVDAIPKNKNLVICGTENSNAKLFAQNNGFDFELISTAHAHEWNDGEITTPATCTAAGIKTYTCSSCGEAKSEPIAKTPHKAETDKAVAATCAKTGKTAGSHCAVCGTVITAQKTVAKKAHTYKTNTTKATVKKNGSKITKCTVCGAVKSKSTIYYPKTITLSKTSYTYDGKVKKPSVTVKDSKGKKISSKNYTVSYAKGRKNVGKYTVTIKFKGNYSGTVKKTFTIKPKATSLSKLTAGKKKFTVKWKKLTTQTTGYQIQYSTSSKFKSAKTVTVSKNKTTSKAISKLKAKKKYYVRIRTYKTVKVNGKNTKLYSSWSKTRSVTTKK